MQMLPSLLSAACDSKLLRCTSVDEEETVPDWMLDDGKLLVFGRFRQHEGRGYQVGDMLALGAATRSLQTESNPTGEWIGSRMIASTGHVCVFSFSSRFPH